MIRSRRGMTLMELMVAVVVAGMMAIIGTSTFSAIIDHKAIIETASASTERGAALHEMLHTWLYSGTVTMAATTGTGGVNSTTLVMTNTFGQRTVSPAVVTGDALTFTTLARTPLNTAVTTMRLFIDDDINTPEQGLTLEYRGAGAQAPLMRVQLDTTIVFMSVEYRDTRTNQWFSSQNAVLSRITPKAARIVFVPSDSLTASGVIGIPILVPMGPNPTAAPNTTVADPPAAGGL